MRVPTHFILFCVLAIAFANCRNNQHFNLSLPLPPKEVLIWKCHQNYTYVFDAQLQDSCLCIIGYPNQEYPGIELDWLKAPWVNKNSLSITVKSLHPKQTNVSLLLFDDSGPMEFNNRFQKSITTTGNWDTLFVDLKQDLLTPSGRCINISKPIQAVLYTTNLIDTIKLCIGSITMH